VCEKSIQQNLIPAQNLKPPTEVPDPDFLAHPLIAKYAASERRAISVHRFFLSVELQRSASVEETVKRGAGGPARGWRRDKMRRDGAEQHRQILMHKWYLSQRAGHDVGEELAALDWVSKHAGAWRTWWEEQPESGA
jgi:predicted component of type VI protein secretion system